MNNKMINQKIPLVFAAAVIALLILVLALNQPAADDETEPIAPEQAQPTEEPTACDTDGKKVTECEELFEERMGNVEKLLNSIYSNAPPTAIAPPTISTDLAKSKYAKFAAAYKTCGADTLEKKEALLKELRNLDKSIPMILWDERVLEEIACIEVAE